MADQRLPGCIFGEIDKGLPLCIKPETDDRVESASSEDGVVSGVSFFISDVHWLERKIIFDDIVF